MQYGKQYRIVVSEETELYRLLAEETRLHPSVCATPYPSFDAALALCSAVCQLVVVIGEAIHDGNCFAIFHRRR